MVGQILKHWLSNLQAHLAIFGTCRRVHFGNGQHDAPSWNLLQAIYFQSNRFLGLSESWSHFVINKLVDDVTRKSKVRQSRNYFFKPTFLPKNEQTNSTLLLVYDTSGRLVFVRFLEEIEDNKKTFRNQLNFILGRRSRPRYIVTIE